MCVCVYARHDMLTLLVCIIFKLFNLIAQRKQLSKKKIKKEK